MTHPIPALLSIYLLFAWSFFPVFAQRAGKDPFTDSLLRTEKGLYRSLAGPGRSASVRILYSAVDRTSAGIPRIKVHSWNSDSLAHVSSRAVHLPLALLALHKMAGFSLQGINRNTTMITEAETDDQMPAYNDPRWPGGKPALERYVTNLLLLHEPSSFDRLYEFLGQAFIEDEFRKRGYDIRYRGRLERETDDAARRTNPVVFYDENMKPLLSLRGEYNANAYSKFALEKGREDRFVLDPESLHRLFTSIIYPEAVNPGERFDLPEDDRRFLLTCISRLPEETVYPYHDPASLDPDAFFAAILPGKPGARIFNTGGIADGDLTESLFFIDTSRGVEFLITVSLSAHDGIIDDADYDLLPALGEVFYRYETGRRRAVKPDLSPFVLPYDR